MSLVLSACDKVGTCIIRIYGSLDVGLNMSVRKLHQTAVLLATQSFYIL